jgi:hypothetical protein
MLDRRPQLDGECQRIAERFSWQEWEMWRERGWPIPRSLERAAMSAVHERARQLKQELQDAQIDDEST